MAGGARANAEAGSYPLICLNVTTQSGAAAVRHARACPGHPRSCIAAAKRAWMAGTSPAMTMWMDLVKSIRIAIVLTAISSSAHAQSLSGGFVYLRDIDPSIIQDIRYASSNNFIGRPMSGYGAGECVVKREVGVRLKA